MIIVKTHVRLHTCIQRLKLSGNSIGFVPTMGGLHAGHMALIRASGGKNHITVCSIFVNPAQFNEKEDYQNYPITLENDIDLLEKTGVDILFLPTVSEIYPHGWSALKRYDLGEIEFILEGESRPGHFQGVCQVVHRLLETISPDILYLGQKDFQQCLVVRKLLELTDLDKAVQVEIIPTVREESGLAMSSRNMRLDATMRKKATAIYRSLIYIRENREKESPADLTKGALQMIREAGLKPDYVVIAEANTLKEVVQWNGSQSKVALAAAYAGNIRLIDNLVIE